MAILFVHNYHLIQQCHITGSVDSETDQFIGLLCRCVPMNVISRDAVPMIPMQLARSFHEEQPDNTLFKYLYQVQTDGLIGVWGQLLANWYVTEHSLVQLWRKVCRGQVPERCDKKVHMPELGRDWDEVERH